MATWPPPVPFARSGTLELNGSTEQTLSNGGGAALALDNLTIVIKPVFTVELVLR